MVDIYGDLENFDFSEELDKLKNDKSKLEEKISALEKENSSLSEKNKSLEEKYSTVVENISSLLKTSKAEIERKDKTIVDLRKRLDDLTFRRQNRHVPKVQDGIANCSRVVKNDDDQPKFNIDESKLTNNPVEKITENTEFGVNRNANKPMLQLSENNLMLGKNVDKHVVDYKRLFDPFSSDKIEQRRIHQTQLEFEKDYLEAEKMLSIESQERQYPQPIPPQRVAKRPLSPESKVSVRRSAKHFKHRELISPDRRDCKRSKSPVRESSSKDYHRSEMAHRRKSKSPSRKHSSSPYWRHSRSPRRKRSRSPHRKHLSPGRRRSRSPYKKHSRSPHRRNERLYQSHTKSPHRRRHRSSKRLSDTNLIRANQRHETNKVNENHRNKDNHAVIGYSENNPQDNCSDTLDRKSIEEIAICSDNKSEVLENILDVKEQNVDKCKLPTDEKKTIDIILNDSGGKEVEIVQQKKLSDIEDGEINSDNDESDKNNPTEISITASKACPPSDSKPSTPAIKENKSGEDEKTDNVVHMKIVRRKTQIKKEFNVRDKLFDERRQSLMPI